MKYTPGVLALIVACGLLPGSSALADGAGLEALQTPLNLGINPPGAGESGLFRIAKPAPEANSAATYRLDSGTVEFRISDRVGNVLDNPLFCFDFAPEGGSTQLWLDISSVDGRKAVEGLGIDSVIQYAVDDSLILVTPPSSSQCFYRGVGENGQFGLYGRAPEIKENGSTETDGDDDPLFGDSFEAEMKLEVSFEGLPSTISNGSQLYRLEIRNAGQGDLSTVSFKEVYPTDLNLYPVAMDGIWDCGGGLTGSEAVRVEKVAIAAGETITCSITRLVTGTGRLRLHAAAVSGPGPNALFDVAEVEVEVTVD